MKPILNTKRLKEKREEKGWSRNQAAQEIGLLQSAYSRYESGQNVPSLSVLKIIAMTLGTSVEYLAGKTDDPSPDALIVRTKDLRLEYIINSYSSLSSDNKERLYKYALKIGGSNSSAMSPR
jgi:transcriptional regulator with XRE-family HTH domain